MLLPQRGDQIPNDVRQIDGHEESGHGPSYRARQQVLIRLEHDLQSIALGFDRNQDLRSRSLAGEEIDDSQALLDEYSTREEHLAPRVAQIRERGQARAFLGRAQD